jgi:hypothetical protein
MMCAGNMMAFIPPVAPSSSAAERFGPGHHTLGYETLAAMFYLNVCGFLCRVPPYIFNWFFVLEISCPFAHFAAKFYSRGFAWSNASVIMNCNRRPGSHSAI